MLTELFKITPKQEKYNSRSPIIIDDILKKSGTTQPAKYEASVFQFFDKNMTVFGIKKIFRLENTSIDGYLELESGQTVGVEVKYKMNWDKACVSEFQFKKYQRIIKNTSNINIPKFSASLVIFENFSNDWMKKSEKRNLETGWTYWYNDHFDQQIALGYNLYLLQLKGDTLFGLDSTSQLVELK